VPEADFAAFFLNEKNPSPGKRLFYGSLTRTCRMLLMMHSTDKAGPMDEENKDNEQNPVQAAHRSVPLARDIIGQ
jgi:hypothetical protein